MGLKGYGYAAPEDAAARVTMSEQPFYDGLTCRFGANYHWPQTFGSAIFCPQS